MLTAQAETTEHRFQHEHVLGTSLELTLRAPSREIAQAAERTALAEIERLRKILSRYDAESELMRWQAAPLNLPHPVSHDLAAVLFRAEHWRRESHGVFEVRVAGLVDHPSRASMNPALFADEGSDASLRMFSNVPYTVTTSSDGNSITAARHDTLAITLDGLAKGYIIDCVCAAIRERFPSIDNFMVNIGGDLRKVGDGPLEVAVANPFRPAEGDDPVATFLTLGDLALATSGNYRRFIEVQGSRGSHIIDPRTGRSADHIASATVLAPTAVDADALATIVSVLAPSESLSLVQSLPHAECLLVLANGETRTSAGWLSGKAHGEIRLVAAPKENQAPSGLFVHFTLNRPENSIYRRPYLAIWLENADGFPVKTALLWLQTQQPGPRWHRDLTRWYRNDRSRMLVENTDLISTIAGATRGPGEYTAHFDGNDNAGKPLPNGTYKLCLELAREHGTYKFIRKTIELNGKPIPKTSLKGNVEISPVSFEYIPLANRQQR